ncbi:diguanylate cyclase [Paenibacillus athensensis]|uniref:Diguanylate cyclase n=1 Tax=Paenibacillus athensensis TaxID=1967502 RepID=A0A4Y8Q1H1_9BACL|nr:MASE4 domain-containing protein [Paenibacillus athensensis]MCD1258314.1 diguanylate cyclase [Paenibacillus athensensis]
MKASESGAAFTLNLTGSLPSRRHKTAALVVGLLLAAVVTAALPLARHAGTAVPAFLPAFIAAVFFGEMVTMYLVYSEFQVSRSPSLLVLGSAYLYSGLIVVPHILTFPGVFAEQGLLHAGTQSATWLWVFWHGGYPALIGLYVWVEKRFGARPVKPALAGRLLAVAVTATVALVIGLTLLAIFGGDALPAIIQKNNYRILITSGVGPVVWALNLLAFLAVFLVLRGKTIIHVWLIIAMLASLLDVTLTLFSGSRYSLGWYVARMNSLLSAGVVLAVLLYEIRSLYYRIVRQERIFRTVFEFAAVGIARIDLQQKPLEANQAFLDMLGYRMNELQQRSLPEFQHAEDSRIDQRLLEELIAGERSNVQIEKRYLHKNGSLVWANSIVSLVRGVNDEPEFFIGMVEDITRRKEFERQIHFQAYHDALTGLPNRALFGERLQAGVQAAARQAGSLGLLFLDLDGFKRVNDTLGHDIGDLLLQSVAERLRACIGPEDLAARMGGDEFTVIVGGAPKEADIRHLSERILGALAVPFTLNGHEAAVSASIGLCLYPQHGEDVQTLMKHADLAMYAAKEAGKNRVAVFSK